MKCEFGYCSICEKEIAPSCPQCGIRKAGSQYTEVEVEWSNKARMKIAVCADCAVKNAHAKPEVKAGITKAHHEYWDKANEKYDKEIVIV